MGHEVGPGARRKLYEMFYQAMPDARAEALDVIAEGDKVVIVDRFGGTHRGEFLRRDTGDRIEWIAIHIYIIRDGKGRRHDGRACHYAAARSRANFSR